MEIDSTFNGSLILALPKVCETITNKLIGAEGARLLREKREVRKAEAARPAPTSIR